MQDCHLERLKVTLLGEEWTSQGGGLSTFNRELAKHLAKLKHSEVEVTLLVPRMLVPRKIKTMLGEMESGLWKQRNVYTINLLIG